MSFNHTPWYFGWYENHEVPRSDEVGYEIIRTKKELTKIHDKVARYKPEKLGVDTETTSLDHTEAELVGVCFNYGRDNGYYIPVSHFKGTNANDGVVDTFYELFIENYDGLHVFWNSRYDLRIFESQGYDTNAINDFDVPLLLYNGYSAINNISLENIKAKVLGWDTVEIDNTKLRYYKPEKVLEYTAGDPHATWLVYDLFNELRDRMQSVGLDNDFIRPLKYIEEVPKQIDLEWFRQIYRQACSRREKLERQIHETFDTKFNVDSGDELRRVLNARDLDTGERTPTDKMGVGKEALENIEDEFEGIELILEYRDYDKHINTYIENFLPDTDIQALEDDSLSLFNDVGNKATDEMYFSYRNTKTRSGRLSAGKDTNNPFFAPINIQNIPKESKCYWKVTDGNEVFEYDFVKAESEANADFKAPDTELSIRHGIRAVGDRYYVSFDHSGQEICLIANLSNDETMLELLKNDKDVHKKTLDEVLKPIRDDFTRDHAKMTNFGVLYGAGVYRVKNMLNISEQEAEKLLENMWNTYPGVKKHLDKMRQKARNDGYIKNKFGRPRWVQSLYESDNEGKQKHADNVVGNHGIQSMGAECIKQCTIDAYYNLFDDKRISDDNRIDIESIVHDEINFSIAKDRDTVYELIPRLEKIMEVDLDEFEVKIETDCEIGVSWGKMAPLTIMDDELLIAGEYSI